MREDYKTHWDEIRQLAQQGGNHLLYELLLSTIEGNALAAFRELTDVEQYALWVTSGSGQDCLQTYRDGGSHHPENLVVSSESESEIVQKIRVAVLSHAARA